MAPETEPDHETEEAERVDAHREHRADRTGDADDEAAGDAAAASMPEEERERVREHEQEMAERGAHQEGEGRID